MRRAGDFSGPGAAELRRAFEEGRAAGAAGQAPDRNDYRASGRQAAWLQGWHQGQRDKEAPPPGAVVERVSHPALDALRAKLEGFAEDFGPGWFTERGKQRACWFDRQGGLSLCGRYRHDAFWTPAPDIGQCVCCTDHLEWRSRPLAPTDPERRSELEREFHALIGRSKTHSGEPGA